MALPKASMISREHRPADVYDGDANACCGVLQKPFSTAQPGCRQMVFASGKGIGIVISAANSNQLLNLVVIGSNVFVADGPGDFPAIPLRRLKVEVGASEADAPPDIGLPAMSPHPEQTIRLRWRRQQRLLLFGQEKFWRLFTPMRAFPPFVGSHMRPEISAVEALAGIEHEHIDALTSQIPGRHPARGAGTDDDHVM